VSAADGVLELVDFDLRLAETLREIPGFLVEWERPPYPADGEDAPEKPYGILYAIPWDDWSGAANLPHMEVRRAVQVTVVGETHEQAAFVMDSVRVKWLAWGTAGEHATSLDVAGVRVLDRIGVSAPGGDADSLLVQRVERFVFTLSAT
jgi:hypothetical protein